MSKTPSGWALMRRHCFGLAVAACLVVGALLLCFVVLKWDNERAVMQERYDRIQVGSKFADVESVIGMPSNGMRVYPRRPVLVAGTEPNGDQLHQYFQWDRYTIMVEYHRDTGLILGKGLYRGAGHRGWVARVFGP